MKRWLILLLVAGCASGGTGAPRDKITVEIQNQNWWATTVYIVCSPSGRRMVVRGLVYGEKRIERYMVRDCRNIEIYVEGLGRRAHRVREPVMVQNGDKVCMAIQPSPYMTTFSFNCTRRS